MVDTIKTQPTEFERFLSCLPQLLKNELILIPLKRNDKSPDVPYGKSWKNSCYHLSIAKAIKRLEDGLNVGIVAHDNLVVVDVDDLQNAPTLKPTLEVITRDGNNHYYYLNGGDVSNFDLPKVMEVRANNRYVAAPGSYVPPSSTSGSGLYRVRTERTLSVLYASELPKKLIIDDSPSYAFNHEDKAQVSRLILQVEYRNRFGWSLAAIRDYDEKLDKLLSVLNPGKYKSPSEADMAVLQKLRFWGYDEDTIFEIIKKFRPRNKLSREYYLTRSLSRIAFTKTIADFVDVHNWHPLRGYGASRISKQKCQWR